MKIEFGENATSKRETLNGMDAEMIIRIEMNNIKTRIKALANNTPSEWMGRKTYPDAENIALLNRESDAVIGRMQKLINSAKELQKQ